MGIIMEKRYSVKCDKCGTLLGGGFFNSLIAVEICAENESWEIINAKYYCPHCSALIHQQPEVASAKPKSDESD